MNKNKVTIVTGLWDLGRENIDGWAKRSFQHYKDRFSELLRCDANLAIWIPRELEEEVWKIRDKSQNNTILERSSTNKNRRKLAEFCRMVAGFAPSSVGILQSDDDVQDVYGKRYCHIQSI
jgi:hypothetical protein